MRYSGCIYKFFSIKRNGRGELALFATTPNLGIVNIVDSDIIFGNMRSWVHIQINDLHITYLRIQY